MTQAVSKALVSAGAVKGSIITVGSIVGKVTYLEQYQALDYIDSFSRNLTYLHHRCSGGWCLIIWGGRKQTVSTGDLVQAP